MLNTNLAPYQPGDQISANSMSCLISALLAWLLFCVIFFLLVASLRYFLSYWFLLIIFPIGLILFQKKLIRRAKIESFHLALVFNLVIIVFASYLDYVAWFSLMDLSISLESISGIEHALITLGENALGFAHANSQTRVIPANMLFNDAIQTIEPDYQTLIIAAYYLIPSVYLNIWVKCFYQSHSFCKQCNEWTEEQYGMVAFYHKDFTQLEFEFKQGSYGVLQQALPMFNQPISDYYQINVEICVSCNDFFTMQLIQMKKASDLDKTRPIPITPKMVASRPYFQHFSLSIAQFPVPEWELA